MLAQAAALGALVAVDIGPAIGTPAGLPELAELLPLVNILMANEHELAVATGLAMLEEQVATVLAAGAGDCGRQARGTSSDCTRNTVGTRWAARHMEGAPRRP